MTFIEAIKTKRPLTRIDIIWTIKSDPFYYMPSTFVMRGTFIAPEILLNRIELSIDDILSNDWIVEGGLTPENFETVG
jgi:hypothetical protein